MMVWNEVSAMPNAHRPMIRTMSNNIENNNDNDNDDDDLVIGMGNANRSLMRTMNNNIENNDDDNDDDDLIIGMGNAHRQGSQGTKNPYGKNYHLKIMMTTMNMVMVMTFFESSTSHH